MGADWPALAAAFFGPLFLYGISMAPTVVLEDDGLFLMVTKHLGIAHPPGYPLYTILGHLFMALPGNPAVLGHLFSGLAMAGACVLVYICARLLAAAPWPALAAAWLFGCAEHVWSQAIIAEVYGLNALLFFAIYALLLLAGQRAAQGRSARSCWQWAAVLFGLALANHWPLMVLASPGLLVAVLPAWRTLVPGLPSLAGLSLVSTALPYGWLVWRSLQEPIISFSGPINSLGRFWHILSRQDYARVDVSAAAGWGDRWAFLGWFGQQVVAQLTVAGLALALLGLVVLLGRRQWAALGSGLLVFAGHSVVLLLVLAFEFNDHQTSIFRPYPLVCFGLVAIWLAVGAQTSLEWIGHGSPLKKYLGPGSTARLATALAATTTVALTANSVQAHWSKNNRSNTTFAQDYGELVFSLVPQDAILMVHGDTDLAPLGYYHFVENRRPDIKLLNTQGLIFNNRLYPPNLSQERKQEIFNAFLGENERPLFFTGKGNLTLPHGVRHNGFIQELAPDVPVGQIQVLHEPSVDSYYRSLLAEIPENPWEQRLREQLLFLHGEYLGLVVLANEPQLLEKTKEVRTMAQTSFFTLMGMAEALLEHGTGSHLNQVDEFLQRAESRRPDGLGPERVSRLLYLQGFLRFHQGDPQGARTLFEASYRGYPSPDNASLGALQQLDNTANP